MRHYCGHCDYSGTLETLDIFEGIESYMGHCPRCGGILVEWPYEEISEFETEQLGTIRELLPNEDQCRYLTHLCNKQVAKLEGAKKQLEELIGKTQVMLEIVQENGE